LNNIDLAVTWTHFFAFHLNKILAPLLPAGLAVLPLDFAAVGEVPGVSHVAVEVSGAEVYGFLSKISSFLTLVTPHRRHPATRKQHPGFFDLTLSSLT
jgi:hypothetical protein